MTTVLYLLNNSRVVKDLFFIVDKNSSTNYLFGVLLVLRQLIDALQNNIRLVTIVFFLLLFYC